MDDFTFSAAKPVEKYHKIDIWLVISIILLWGLGIFTIYFTSPVGKGSPFRFVGHQLIASAVGFVLFLFFAVANLRVIQKIVPAIVIGSMALCILTYLPWFSKDINGARRWIYIGNVSFQSSELMKFSLVLFLANYLDRQDERVNLGDTPSVLPCVIVLLIFSGLVFGQKDLSTCVFIFGLGIILFFAYGARLRWLIPLTPILIGLFVLMILSERYRLDRILGWFNPDQHTDRINYQPINARKAIIEGGIWGQGIGQGLTRVRNIPEVQADFIFAGWAEAMGFLGVLGYMLILGFFAFRGYRAAFKTPSKFGAFGCFGCVTLIIVQSLMNCLVVCGLLPTTGIPLPFFSLGGSSIIVTLGICGFIVNASSCREMTKQMVVNDENDYETIIDSLTD